MRESSARAYRGSDDHDHPENADDEELLHFLQDGCDRCFEILFARYWRLVLAISWKIIRERSAAEDVVQEVFLTIYLKRNLYDSTRGSIKTWIAQFAHFKAMIKRRQVLSQGLTYLEELTQFESEMSELNAHQEILERAALVEECLSALNPRQRRAIELVHFEGYTLVETSAILGESLANTRNIYYRGIKALRSHLAQPGSQHDTGNAGPDLGIAAATGDSLIWKRMCKT